MRYWLRQTIVRIIISVIVLSLLVIAFTWWPTHQAKRLIHNQLQLDRQTIYQLQQSSDLVGSLPALSQQNLRKQGAMRFYYNQADRGAKQFRTINIVRPGTLSPVLGLSTYGESKIIRDVNETIAAIHRHTIYTNSRNDSQTAAQLLRYHAALAGALINVLEYDPVADMQNFNLKSADSQKRLKLAYDGLIKTDQQLQAAKKIYHDSSIDEVTALISRLRYARYDLSQTGDTAVWITKVEDAQARILANRQSFWTSATAKITSKLMADKADMQYIYSLWQADAKKYSVT